LELSCPPVDEVIGGVLLGVCTLDAGQGGVEIGRVCVDLVVEV
jgi:hypothetical protein